MVCVCVGGGVLHETHLPAPKYDHASAFRIIFNLTPRLLKRRQTVIYLKRRRLQCRAIVCMTDTESDRNAMGNNVQWGTSH